MKTKLPLNGELTTNSVSEEEFHHILSGAPVLHTTIHYTVAAE